MLTIDRRCICKSLSAQLSWPLAMSPHESDLEATAEAFSRIRENSYLWFARCLVIHSSSCCILFAFEKGTLDFASSFSLSALQAPGDIWEFLGNKDCWDQSSHPHPNNFNHNSASPSLSLFPWCQTGQKRPPFSPIQLFIHSTHSFLIKALLPGQWLHWIQKLQYAGHFRGISTNSLIIMPSRERV